MSTIYTDLNRVYTDVTKGMFKNEHTFRQAFVEALKNEARSYCKPEVIENIIIPILDDVIRGRRPDVVFANVVMELEAPPNSDAPVTRRKVENQLKQYMKKLAEDLLEASIWGLVTNGWRAELWELRKIPIDDEVELRYKKIMEGPMPDVVRHLLRILCSNRITIVRPEDLVAIFGVR